LFLAVRLSGAGDLETSCFKGRVPYMQGFRDKLRLPFRARKIFPRNPKGLTLLVRKEHELPLPVSYGDSATGWQLFPIGLFHKILTGLLPAFTEKMLSLH
uniref:hypothetical protein n=1 Tax=Alistipes putredinis TaxID=28117 RepID=UPI003FD6DB0E